ncbi:MAG: tetratricopeptide repeat protein [Bacteroidales bacterium]|nr:tetratricopeptide repeat protein [Bacteroidales bacterium]
MKRFVFIILGLMLVHGANAQTNNVTAAYNHLRYGKLDKAKEAIDKAIENPKTMTVGKTWFYYGNVYLAIHLSDEPDYKNLDPDALEKAFNGYEKALQYDEKNEFTQEINERLIVCAEQYFNKGVTFYNESNFADAASAFDQAALINQNIGITDTTSYFYTAQSAFFAGKLDLAKQNFQKLIEMNYAEPAIFRFTSEVYKAEADTVKALETIKQGRSRFPDEFSLIIEEINIYLAANEKDKAMELLQIAITKDDKNPTLFFAVGTNYDQMGNFEEAEKNYLKAIELNSEFFDPIYNLGALYVNKAIEITEQANKLPLNEQKKYDELKVQADEYLTKSLPYLEKADQLNPNDVYVLRTLRDIYARLGMLDKLKEVDEKLHQND